MKVRHDEELIELTAAYEEALINLLREECKMHRDIEGPECWTWGRAYISDLANAGGIERTFGGDDCRPDDGLGDFAIVPNHASGGY